jgi:hypothetical protein
MNNDTTPKPLAPVETQPKPEAGLPLGAAKLLNRHWLGIEINEDYIKEANARNAQDVLELR